MKTILTMFLFCAVICGCSTVPHSPPGKLIVQIPSMLGFEASASDFRIFVDGRFAGNYTSDGAIFELPAGLHKIVAELPSAYQRRELPNGGVEIRTFSLRGEERIEIFGGASQQTLVFNSDNLKSREVENESGH